MTEAADQYRELQARLFEQIGRALEGIQVDVRALTASVQESSGKLGRIEGALDGYSRDAASLKDDIKDTNDKHVVLQEKVDKISNRLTRVETLFLPAVSLASAILSALIAHFWR